MNGFESRQLLRHCTEGPEAPLVDLSALNVVGTKQSGVAVGEVLCDRDGFIQVALWSLKHGELASYVDCLILFRGNSLGVNNADGELFASVGSDSSGTESEDVEWVVDVDLLNKLDIGVFTIICVLLIMTNF